MDADTLKALADTNRLEIVRLLASGERCLCDVSAALGISDALASHHVKRLAAAGLVRTRRRGLWLHCSLDADAFAGLSRELGALGVASAETTGGACCGPATEGAVDG